jgi:hypothetical protein
VAEDATSSPPKAAAVPVEENVSRLPLHPYGMRTPTATYASSVSTNLSAYEDLPWHHLLSIRDLIKSTPDSSYPDSADEGYVFMRDRIASDFFKVRVREAFLSFQSTADYCLTCTDDSSEGDYDPSRQCFLVELASSTTTRRTLQRR